jgi:hypothetical protein
VLPELLPTQLGDWLKQLPDASFYTAVVALGFYQSSWRRPASVSFADFGITAAAPAASAQRTPCWNIRCSPAPQMKGDLSQTVATDTPSRLTGTGFLHL